MKKSLVRILAAMSAVMLSLCLAAPVGSAASLAQPQNSMVIIYGTDSSGKDMVGVGFAVGGPGNGADTFITLYDLSKSKDSSVEIVYDVVDKGHMIHGEVQSSDETLGIAIVKADSPVPNRSCVTLASAKDVQKGDAVSLLSFPDKGGIASKDVVYGKGTVIDPAFTYNGMSYLQTNCNLDNMNLGAPLVNEKGEVIGIFTGFASKDGTSLILPADQFPDASSSSGSSGTSGSGTSGGKSGGTGTIMGVDYRILIGAGVVVVALYLFWRRKKKKGDTRPAPVSAPAPFNPVPPPMPFNNATMPVNPAQQPAGNPVQVCGMSGHFNGNRISVPDRILMGRDPKRCGVVFPAQTEGVSALHCELRNAYGRLELTDLGSTYGTFMGDGCKLEANRPYLLQNGDVFYLGAQGNKFRVGA